jgi:hypothetical protein
MTASGSSHLWYLVGYHGDIILTINVAEKTKLFKNEQDFNVQYLQKLIILGKHM